MQRRPRGGVSGILLGHDDSKLLALNDGSSNCGVEERREYEDVHADGCARTDLVESRACFVDFIAAWRLAIS